MIALYSPDFQDHPPIESNKRPRLNNDHINSTSGGVTHVSETAVATSSDVQELPTTVPQQNSISEDAAALQARLAQLMKINAKLAAENRDYKSALEDVQFRFEEQTRELRNTTKEREDARAETAKVQRQLEATEKRLTNSTDQRIALAAELKTTTDALTSSNVAELVEYQRLRVDEAGKAKLETRLERQEAQMGFIREQYQTASETAATLGREVEALQKENARLQTQSSGDQVKLRQLVIADERKTWKREIERKDGRIRDLEGLCSRTREENENLKKQRAVNTRQGSMPRSPRMAPLSRMGSPAPLQLGVGANRFRGVQRD